jgi:hypothetical protein
MRRARFRPGGNPFCKGASRAVGDALTTRNAGRFAQRLAIVGDHEAPVSALGDPQDMMPLDLPARPDAAPAQNAPIEIHPDERMRVVYRMRRTMAAESTAGKVMAFGEDMQLTLTPVPVREALGRMTRNQ